MGDTGAMQITSHNPPTVFAPYRNYAHAIEVPAGARTLYISGLNGYESDGQSMPSDFAGQAALVWSHLGAILESARMRYDDLVSLRFFLASPADDPANVEILAAHLGVHLAARTVVVQQLLEPGWLVEIEAVAAKVD
jgi:2-iminobutanoate/2-iminopropanoate deaminase